MDRPYQPRFTNPSRHPNHSPNLSSASSPASPVAYHHPSHHGSPYAPELKHHRPSKSFSSSSRNTPPPTSTYSAHGPGMDDRRYMSQPPPPHPPPPSHHRQSSMNSNEKRPAYPGDRVPNWNDSMDERYHDPRGYRTHEQPPPGPPPLHQQQQHPREHQQHPLHPSQHPPPHHPHRDDRSAPHFHRQENATPPLSESASSGRSMLNASPQMYRDREPPHPHPQSHPHPHPHHPHPHSHPPPHYAQQQPQGPPQQPQSYPQQGPSLQSAQQQHHQLQQQLQQAAPSGHSPSASQGGPFPPQHLFSQSGPHPPPPPPGHPGPPPPSQHHHQRSASYSEPPHQQPQSQYHPSPRQAPGRLPATANRPMPPPSPPHYPRTSQGPPPPPPHAQNYPPPPPPTGAPFRGTGRDLPSLSSLEIAQVPRPSNMSLSSILGDAPPGPPARLESLSQSIFREPPPPPPRTLGPDLSPLKRPYTPGDRSIGGHAIEPSRSNSPPLNKTHFPETRTPPYRHGPSISRPREGPQFSPPTRPLSQPTFPPQPESQPQHQSQPPPTAHTHPQHPPAPYHPQDRIPEREQYSQPPPHFRQPNHLRTSSYPDSPYQRQVPEPPRREPTPPRSIQHPPPRQQAPPNVSPQITHQPQPQASPSYHHPAPPTSSATSISFNAYTTQMPESPFAITPGLSNQHTISSLHQYDSDRKKANNSGLGEPGSMHSDRPPHDQKPWDREHLERERSTDIPPLRAEEALVKGIHERKYPGTFTPVSQSPKLKREVIVVEEQDPSHMMKRDDHDIEMGGVEMTMSPMKRGEIPLERATKKRKGYLGSATAVALNSGSRSDSTLSNMEEPPSGGLGSTPVKIGNYTSTPAASPANNTIPTIPPPQVIDNSDVVGELKKHERHHLGSMVYTPTLLKKSGSVKSYSHIPLFSDQENCTFIVRVPWYCLNLEERERVCKKRLLWGAEVYSDDSNILAVLVHLGYIPAVRDGHEVSEFAEAHDAVVAKLSATKRRGAGGNRGREMAAAAMAETGAPKVSGTVQVGKDLLVKIVIVGNLGRYASVVRYGLKSRSWDDGHDGMGFMVEDVKWVDGNVGFGDVRGGRGVHDRLKKWEKMRRRNETIETLVTTVTTSGKARERAGVKWLVKEGLKAEEEKENLMEVDGEKEKNDANTVAAIPVVTATA
ncbi:hypothetical protein TWF694_001995 [Orbilia ellipsospora]|uniref:Histone deacetylation protein Rxt3 n=1 Tax=Orbilia ellipsospora TaxID=2528407 RepID=A0AAV9X5E7_9PEZI